MARYTGPKSKISRRFGVAIFGPSKALERKNYGPGMHGPKGSRRKQSEYAVALGEKQKLRYQYGVLERQFRRYFSIASTRRGVTGEILLQLLETRLDNVVYRLKFATTIFGAQQLVSHGHILVDGKKVGCSAFEKHVDFQEDISADGVNRRLKGSLYISTTGILPKFQGKGFGSLLKAWQVCYARSHGFTRIVTNSRKRNTRMITLNRKFGFRVIRTTPKYYSGPSDSTVVMELLLPRRPTGRPTGLK